MKRYYIELENRELGEYGIEFFSVSPSSVGTVTHPHIHPSLEFIYIKSGVFEVSVDNTHTFTAYPGSMLIFRANTIHTILNASDIRAMYYVLKIAPTLVFSTFVGENQSSYTLPFLQKKGDDVVCIGDTEMPHDIHALWNEMIAEHERAEDTFYFAQRINASRLLLLLVRNGLPLHNVETESKEISERSVEQIYTVIDYVNSNFASNISPIECAEMLHISYGYFAKLFKTVMGKTFKQYLTDVRMSRAHTLLISTDSSVTEIASRCGYDNVSYFVAEYKKTFGTTPKAVQKEAKYKKLGNQ